MVRHGICGSALWRFDSHEDGECGNKCGFEGVICFLDEDAQLQQEVTNIAIGSHERYCQTCAAGVALTAVEKCITQPGQSQRGDDGLCIRPVMREWPVSRRGQRRAGESVAEEVARGG